MKSYYEFHELAYKNIEKNNFVGWGNKKTIAELSDVKTLNFLRESVAAYFKTAFEKSSLDLGCGTGATAFELSKLGFSVTGVDISATAIKLANALSAEQKMSIDFKVHDILDLELLNKKFDLIYDSHCLHCIVFDEDRLKVLSGAKKILNPDGIFILDTMISTDGFDPAKDIKNLKYDTEGILWHKTDQPEVAGVQNEDGQFWCPQRRFYSVDKILSEVKEAGLEVLSQHLDHQGDGLPDMLRLILK